MPRGGKPIPIPIRFWAKAIVNPSQCWGWRGGTDKDGYGLLGRGGAGQGMMRAHRASYEMHNGAIPPGMMVLHRCDNPPCTNPAHLFLGTNRDNIVDRDAKRRQARGSRVASSKLTEEAVAQIRTLVASGMTQTAVGQRFGVSQSCVSRIASGEGWGLPG